MQTPLDEGNPGALAGAAGAKALYRNESERHSPSDNFSSKARVTPARRNPVKAVRRHCLACCGGSSRLVAECPSVHCALWPFRTGKNPYRAQRPQKPKARIPERENALAEGCEHI